MKLGLLAIVVVAALSGCGTPLRYEMTRAWYPAPDVEPATTAVAASPSAATGDPADAPAAAAVPAATDPQPNPARSSFYLTYWDGKCCFEGAPKVIRCAVQADNSLACREEVEAEKALQP